MTKFNPNILSDPLGGVATQFGVPSCMVGLAKDALSLLPGDILGGMAAGISEGKNAAQNVIASTFEAIHDKLGILEYDTTTGKLNLIGDSSQNGIDGGSGGVLGAIGGFVGNVAGAGMALWQAGQNVMDQVDSVLGCLDEFQKYLDKGDKKAQTDITRTKGEFLVLKAQTQAAQDFIDQCDETLDNINLIMGARAENPDLIPIFAPVDAPPESVSPIFRLTYGPPKAKKGQYLLSVDGLYYDSQERTYADGSPVPTAQDLSFVPAKDRWKLDHSPNLGGRGTSYSIKDLNDYVDTLFDLNKIDNTTSLETYYEADHFLQVLQSQRNQTISTLNKNIIQLQTSGYSPESALHINYVQQIKSQNAAFNRKINKRKKQIEVAVKAPDLFGSDTLFGPGQVPVNDFSYLSSINLDVELDKQKGLVFDQGEISGLVLPIVPTFVHSEGRADKVVLTPLELPPTGIGSNIDGEELEASPMLSLTTNVSLDGLEAIYNFADVNIQTPESQEFKTLNCVALGTENRAQTVSTDLSLLFKKGLGLPYLTGIPRIDKKDATYAFFEETWDTYPFNINGVGSYVKLPDTPTYQDLLYRKEGASIDVWTHMPGLNQEESTTGFPSHPWDTSAFGFNLSSSSGKWCDAHYYRVLLGCENTGGEDLDLNQSSVVIDRNSTNVGGLLMGFSRDPRMYYEDGIIQPGPTDWNIKQNYGGVMTSAMDASGWKPDGATVNGINGIWTVSSVVSNAPPQAAIQASGTFSTAEVQGERGVIQFTVTNSGDKYPLSSNEACCILWVSGYKGSTSYTPSNVGTYLSISPFNNTLQMGSASTCFFVAPTQSYNTSSVGFVKNAKCQVESADILKFVVSTEKVVGTTEFSKIKSEFVNLTIVFDVPNNLLKFYVNGVLFKEQGLSEVFGTPVGVAPQLPSFMVPPIYATSSFYYSKDNVNQAVGTNYFDTGPTNYPQFTPWIVGGGWTDGRPVSLDTSSGGFLDTGAGIISSYNGYVGNLKIYNRALNTKEVLKNYKAQRDFFSNLDLA
jgi:hypothetical protein